MTRGNRFESGQESLFRHSIRGSGILPVFLAVVCLCVSSVPGAAQCGSDPGNDTMEYATPMGGCGQGSYCLDYPDDIDVYTITPDGPAELVFETFGETDTFMELLNAAGQVISQNDDGGTGTNARISRVVDAGGTYYIRIRGYVSSETGAYDFSISGCCGDDPYDNDFDHATDFNGYMLLASIDCAGDVDLYEFVGTEPGRYTFSFVTSENIVWALYDAAHTQTTQYSNEPSRQVELAAGEHLFIGVKGFDSGDTGDYSLQLTDFTGEGGCGDDPGNNDTAHATDLGSQCGSTFAGIDCLGDIDFYRFVPPTTATFNFYTTGDVDTFITIYDDGGNYLDSDDDGGQGTNASVEEPLTQGSTYFIAVNEYGNNATGGYHLFVAGCTSGGCGDDPGNDDSTHATPILQCGATDAAIQCAGDDDWYSFQAPADATYTWTIDPTNRAGLILYAADAVTEIDAGQNSISATIVQGDIVFVAVSAADSSDTFNYTLTLSGCPSGSGCGNDPGNDDTAHATDLGGQCTTIQAQIDCLGDEDYYLFVAPTTGHYAIGAAGTPDTYLRLYHHGGGLLAQDADSGVDYNPRIEWDLVAGVAYDIVVHVYDNDQTGYYSLGIAGCSGGCGDDPGNDDSAHATDLGSQCGTTNAQIDCVGDEDHYRFVPPTTGSYSFATTGTTDTYLQLFDDSGNLLISDEDSGQDANGAFTFTLNQGSTYFVIVTESMNDETGDYSLVISGCSGGSGCGDDPGDDDSTHATPILQCGATDAAIQCAGDDDWYSFQAPADATYTWTIDPTNRAGMILYAADGTTEIDAGQNSISATIVQGDLIYVAVSAADPSDTFNYTLTLSGCPSGSGCGNDPGNDDISHATDLGGTCGTTPAAFDCAGDIDVYRFTAPNSGPFTLETTGSSDTMMTLKDAQGAVIASDDDGGVDRNARIAETLVQGAAYFVEINEYGNDGTGDYSLVISGCSGSSGCGDDPGDDDISHATDLGGTCRTIPAAIDCPNDEDFYRFTTPSAGQYDFTAGNGAAVLELSDAAGAVLDSDTRSVGAVLTQGQVVILRISAFAPGNTFTYSLDVSGCSSGGCGNDPGDDDFGNATGLGAACGTTPAAIDCPGDGDFYRFSPPADGTYTVTLQAGFNVLVELFDAGHTLLAQENSMISRTLDAGQTYFIAVVSPLGLTGDYQLTVSGCGAVDCTNDVDGDTLAGATNLDDCGSTQHGFECPGDVDFLEFIPSTSGEFTFETTGGMDTMMWLLDSQGNDLDFDDDSGQGLNSRITRSLQSGRRYFLQLQEYGNDGIGDYDLTVAGCNASGCTGDAEGDTLTTAVGLSNCGTFEAGFDCDSDVDVFRFEAPLTVDYTFSTEGSRDTVIRLLDGNGTRIAFDDDSGDQYNARLTRSMTAGDVVYLEITEAAGGMGIYRLIVEGCDATGEPPEQYTYIVTAVAKVSGSEGTNWVSDLAMLNLGETAADVTVALWERDRTNSAPLEVHRTIGVGHLDRTTDVLPRLFGVSEGAATLEIRSDRPLAIGSRTYNRVGDTTYGQFIPGVDLHDAAPAGAEVILGGLTENDDFRTNLGLVNPGDAEIIVLADFFDADAVHLGARSWTVPARGFIQRNRVLREVTTGQVRAGWVRLQAASGRFFSFVSIVDRQSGDPVYRSGRIRPALAGDLLLPGVAKLAGAQGTNWVTDATFTNTTGDDTTVKISLWNRDGDNADPEERSVLLKPGRTSSVGDILSSLFGLDRGAAALQVAAGAGVLIDGRTYNQVSNGTYGQYIPALDEGMAVTVRRKGYLVMPVQNAGFRSNLGLLNPGVRPVIVIARAFDASGSPIGAARSWHLDPREVSQVDRILRRFSDDDFDAAWVEIEIDPSTPDGRAHVFNSVVDQVSGDPIFETVTPGP